MGTLNIVLHEPEIPANHRKYRTYLRGYRNQAPSDRAVGIFIK